MGFGIGGGLAEGLQEGDANYRANQANDRANLGLKAQLEQEHAQTQATTDADARAQALAPGELKEQGSRLGLLADQDAKEKQDLAQGAESFTLEQKQRNGALAMQQMQLTHEQFATMHENALATAKMLNAGLAKPDGTVDVKDVESTFNEGAPAGHRIVPGTLRVTRAANPMDSQITYQGDDGKPHSSTLQQWNTYATAFVPPPKGVVLGSGDRLVNDVTGDTITPATGPGVGKIDPTTYNNASARQVATNNGGIFDENGNLKMMDPRQSAKVGKLSGIAASVGQQTGYSVPPATVASAVQSVADGGTDPDDPTFTQKVMAKLQPGGYGVNQGSPAAPAAGSAPGNGAQPYPEGTKLQDPSGKQYVVQNGKPVPIQ